MRRASPVLGQSVVIHCPAANDWPAYGAETVHSVARSSGNPETVTIRISTAAPISPTSRMIAGGIVMRGPDVLGMMVNRTSREAPDGRLAMRDFAGRNRPSRVDK